MRLNKILMSSAAIVAAFAGTSVQAAGPTLSDVLSASGITVGGTFDASYDWLANDRGILLDEGGNFVAGSPAFRVFDTAKDEFSFHQANITASKAFDGGLGATVNVVMGDDAEVISGDDEVDVTQAFLTYTSGNLTLSGGKYVTLAGMEVINPAGNLNASRSLLFFFQPLTHEGVRASYKINDMLALTLGLNNRQFAGSSGDENNTDLTLEAQAALTPTKNLSAYLTVYSGNEDASGFGDDADIRSDTVDLVVNLNVTDALYVGLNADYFNTEDGAGGHAEVTGVAGYAQFKFLPKWRAVLRSEYLDFEDSYLRENTVTVAHAVTDNFELLLEGRHDKATGDINAEIFAPIDAGLEDDQYTATIKGILKF